MLSIFYWNPHWSYYAEWWLWGGFNGSFNILLKSSVSFIYLPLYKPFSFVFRRRWNIFLLLMFAIRVCSHGFYLGLNCCSNGISTSQNRTCSNGALSFVKWGVCTVPCTKHGYWHIQLHKETLKNECTISCTLLNLRCMASCMLSIL